MSDELYQAINSRYVHQERHMRRKAGVAAPRAPIYIGHVLIPANRQNPVKFRPEELLEFRDQVLSMMVTKQVYFIRYPDGAVFKDFEELYDVLESKDEESEEVDELQKAFDEVGGVAGERELEVYAEEPDRVAGVSPDVIGIDEVAYFDEGPAEEPDSPVSESEVEDAVEDADEEAPSSDDAAEAEAEPAPPAPATPELKVVDVEEGDEPSPGIADSLEASDPASAPIIPPEAVEPPASIESVAGEEEGGEPEEAPETTVEEKTFDLSPLDLSVKKLTKVVEGIDDMDYLQALMDAEEDGKTRKGAISAIADRMDELEEA